MTDSKAIDAAPSQRLDQWLWFARMTKSRTLAQVLIERGKVRVNGDKVTSKSHLLNLSDVLTLTMGPRVRIITVRGISARRGPASEAQALFEELTPEPDRTKSSAKERSSGAALLLEGLATAVRPMGAGRPTKRERRDLERLKDRSREG